jgi:hypothetical protein
MNGSVFMVHGSWFMVNGSWFTVNGSGFTMNGSWFMVHGSWLRGVCEERMPLCGLEEDTYGSRLMVKGS